MQIKILAPPFPLHPHYIAIRPYCLGERHNDSLRPQNGNLGVSHDSSLALILAPNQQVLLNLTPQDVANLFSLSISDAIQKCKTLMSFLTKSQLLCCVLSLVLYSSYLFSCQSNSSKKTNVILFLETFHNLDPYLRLQLDPLGSFVSFMFNCFQFLESALLCHSPITLLTCFFCFNVST